MVLCNEARECGAGYVSALGYRGERGAIPVEVVLEAVGVEVVPSWSCHVDTMTAFTNVVNRLVKKREIAGRCGRSRGITPLFFTFPLVNVGGRLLWKGAEWTTWQRSER